MRCETMVEGLNGLRPGSNLPPPEPAVVAELVSLGLAVDVRPRPGDPEKMERLREQLAENRRAQAALRDSMSDTKSPSAAALSALRVTQKEDIRLREEILSLGEEAMREEASVPVGGRRYALTYKGRDLLATLVPRLRRVAAMELQDFLREMGDLAGSFEARAQRAREILRILSVQHSEVEEIHLRSAAVGLAAHTEAPGQIATVFAALLGAQTAASASRSLTDWRTLIAESLCLAVRDLGAIQPEAASTDFTRLWDRLEGEETPGEEDALVAALILYSYPPEERAGILAEAQRFRGEASLATGVRIRLAPAVLVAREPGDAGERLDRYVGFVRALEELGPQQGDIFTAAAIFAITGRNGQDVVVERYRAARSFLARFAEEGMAVPAAMLAVLSPEVEESLDNLRIASAQISKHRLSLGGMENMSLGMKLMTAVALSPPLPQAPVSDLQSTTPLEVGRRTALGLLGLTIPVTAVVTAFTALHTNSLHRAAVSDYRWHPVHTHYIYG